MRKLYLLLIVALALGLSSVAFAADGDELTIDLMELNDSGITGAAAFVEEGGNVGVGVALTGSTGVHPGHIHSGTCDDLGAVVYPLTNVEGGISSTLVEGVTIEDLLAEPHAVNLHMSAQDIETYVACGDIVAGDDGGEDDGDGQTDDGDDTDGTMPDEEPDTGAGGRANTTSTVPAVALSLLSAMFAAGAYTRTRSSRI